MLGPPEPSPYVGMSPAARTDAVEQLSGGMAALQAELGRVVVAADLAKDHLTDGATDVAAWFGWRTGATGAATPGRPCGWPTPSSTSPPSGPPSPPQRSRSTRSRPVTRFATPATDDDLAHELPGWTAGQAEATARRLTPRPDDEASTAHARRRFGWRPDQKAGGFHYRGFLPTDHGEAVNAVLSALAEESRPRRRDRAVGGRSRPAAPMP